MASLSLVPPRPVRAPTAAQAVGTGGRPHGGPELAPEPGGFLCGKQCRIPAPPGLALPGPGPALGAGRLHFASSSAWRSAASRSDWALASRVAPKLA